MRDFYTKENMQGEAFHVPDAGLLFEPSELSFDTETDTGREGMIRVRHRAGKPARGYVYPSERCMRGVREQFAPGADGTGFIRWQFDARGIAPGRTISGAFRVISPYGEYTIPYTVRISGKGEIAREDSTEIGGEQNSGMLPGGELRSKKDFLDLAERDFQEAVSFFYSGRFQKILTTEEDRTLYRGLSMQEGNLQNVEEFLIAACGREKTVYEQVEKSLFLSLKGQAGSAEGRLAGSRAERAIEAHRQRVRKSTMGDSGKKKNDAPAQSAQEEVVYIPLSIKKYGTGSILPVIRAEGSFLPAAPLGVEEIVSKEILSKETVSKENAAKGIFAKETAVPENDLTEPASESALKSKTGMDDAETAGDSQTQGPDPVTEKKATGIYRVRIPVNRAALHAGRNFGRILIEGPFNEAEVPVEIHCRSTMSAFRRKQERELDQLQLLLMRMYVDFRHEYASDLLSSGTELKHSADWFLQADRLIDEISVRSRRDLVPRLYGVHLLILRGQDAEAARALARIAVRYAGPDAAQNFSARFQGEGEDAYCYRQYLWARCQMDDQVKRNRISRFLRGVYRQTGDWRTAWMLMDLSEEYAPGTAGRWNFLRHQFERGCISPVIFLEAWEMVRRDPRILLPGSSVQERWAKDDFGLHVLWYAARNNILTPKAAEVMVSLAEKKKTFSPLLFKALRAAYEDCDFGSGGAGKTSGERSSAGPSGEKLSVESTDGEPLPESRIKKELLRAVCILLMRRQDLSEKAHRWYARAVREGVVLTRLEENLRLSMPPGESGFRLPAGCNAVLRTTAGRAVRAVLLYDRFRNEQVFPVRDGVAILTVHGDANTVFLEDARGNRYAKSLPYTIDLQKQSEIPSEREDYFALADRIGFGNREGVVLAQSPPERYEAAGRLLDSGLLTGRARTELLLVCLDDSENMLTGPELLQTRRFFLSKANPLQCTQRERALLLEYLVKAQEYEKALQWVLSHGTQEISHELLARICMGFSWENCAQWVQLAVVPLGYEAFLRGNLQSGLLNNLAEFFQGTAQEMLRLRKAFTDKGLSTTGLDKRIIRQALYSGKMLQDHARVIVSAGKKLEEVFLPAVARYADFAFSEGLAMGNRMTDLITGLITQPETVSGPVPDICMIACLKELSMRHGEISERDRSAAAASLTALLSKGIIFPFYRQFPGLDDRLDLYAEETLVQYHPAKPDDGAGRTIVFHYADSRRGETGSFRSRRMKEMYRDFFVSGFLLFYGEQMRYYITDDEAQKHVVQSGVIGQDARILENCSGRFGLINEVTRAAALREYDEALSLLTGYYRRSYLENELFRR